jgi:phosphoenolpyruvate phosphomutase
MKLMVSIGKNPSIREMLADGKNIRLIEAHSALSAMIGSRARYEGTEFDGIWVSSLTESATAGLPDHEIHGFERRVSLTTEIALACDKPILVDGDTGGSIEQIGYRVRCLERAGASGIVIEDKCFPKRNSFASGEQTLASIAEFSAKIRHAKASRKNSNFLIVARTEALVLGLGMSEALIRAQAYIEAGASNILIHSKSSDANEVLDFARKIKDIEAPASLFCVPTSYNTICDSELFGAGFSVVIHANHLLRASMKAMQEAATEILRDNRSFSSTINLISVNDLLNFTDRVFHG